MLKKVDHEKWQKFFIDAAAKFKNKIMK